MKYCDSCDIAYESKYCPLCEAQETIEELSDGLRERDNLIEELKKED